MSVRVKHWRVVYFKPTQAIFSSIVIGLIVVILNSHLVMLNPPLSGQGNRVNCYKQNGAVNWIWIWKLVSMSLYSLVPSLLLFAMNAIFLYRACVKEKTIMPMTSVGLNNEIIHPAADSSSSHLDTKKKMTGLSISVITIGFFICTVPISVTSILYDRLWEAGSNGQLILFVCDAISFTYHSAKFEMLLFYNVAFREEAAALFKGLVDNGVRLKSRLSSESRVITDDSG
jgi:hypothetical protein